MSTDQSLPIRLPEDVKSAANIAGIIPSNQPIQLLHFNATTNTDDIQLLQLTSDITESLKNGQRVVIKGRHTDNAVLCTENTTYDLRLSKTSNSLLLCPDLIYPDSDDYENIPNNIIDKQIIGSVGTILEVKRCRPKLERLKQLLSENPYNGPLNEQTQQEEESGGQKYTLSDLLLLIQASESEVSEGLRAQQACLIDGYWRVFDVDYRDELLQHILTLLEEQDWSWECVPLEECCDKLSELHPSFAIKHSLDCYGISRDDSKKGGVVYKLIEEKVCQFFAEILLRPAGRFNYSEFMECWQQLIPMGMTFDLNQLKGLALKDMNAMPPVIWFFPVEDLPIEPSARFSKLFQVKETWTHEELEPYVIDLVTSSSSLNTVLLKYTRVSTGVNGVKIYYPKTTAL